jgi:hypothetical protein
VRGASADSDVLAVEALDLVSLGAETTVHIRTLDLKPGPSAWTLDLIYDPSILALTTCTGQEKTTCEGQYAPNAARLHGVSLDGLSPGDHALAVLGFRCDSAGTSVLTIDARAWSDATVGLPPPRPVEIRNASITCVEDTPTPASTPTIALPSTGGAADGTDSAWPFAALATFGALALLAGAALARRRR